MSLKKRCGHRVILSIERSMLVGYIGQFVQLASPDDSVAFDCELLESYSLLPLCHGLCGPDAVVKLLAFSCLIGGTRLARRRLAGDI